MKKLLFFLVAALVLVQANAQELPERVQVYRPDYILNMNGKPKGIKPDESWQQWCERQIKSGNYGKKNSFFWDVYSDRDNNVAYTSSNNNDKKGVVNFGKKMRVADVKNGRALCFTTTTKGEYPFIDKNNSTVVGWIPIENLLLYSECPKTITQIEVKGVVVHDPLKAKGEPMTPYFLKTPAIGVTPSSQMVNDLDILYIMKTVKSGGHDFYLLCKSRSSVEDGLLQGWLSDIYVMEWDYRLALEPVYNPAAVAEYQRTGNKPQSFSFELDAKSFYSTGKSEGKPIYTYRSFSANRMDHNVMRHPILFKTDNPSIHRAASIIFFNEDEEKKAIAANDWVDNYKEKVNNINVIFVVDATNSMERYIDAVKDALTKVVEKSFFGKNIKVGCVLYRDYKDHDKFGNKTGGLEYKPLTKDVNSITQFLSGVKVSSIAKESEEGVFDGIETALDVNKMGYEKGQSTFIILIGDAGNYRETRNGPWAKETARLAKKMAFLEVNFLAFQIHNSGKQAYADFGRQLGKLQRNLSDEYIKIMKKGDSIYSYNLIDEGYYALRRAGSYSIYENPVFCEYKFLGENKSLPASDMEKIIEKKMEEFDTWVKGQLTMLNEGLSSPLKSQKGDSDALLDLLTKSGMSQDLIDVYMNDKKSQRILTFVPLKISGKKHSMYNYVLLFSDHELNTLIHELDKINGNSTADGRKVFQDAVIAMGQAMIGNFDLEKNSSMSMDDLMSQIYGVPIKLKTNGDFTIESILSMDKNVLEKYISDFRNRLQGLKQIQKSQYDGRFSKSGNKYYWLPLNDMPGFNSYIN